MNEVPLVKQPILCIATSTPGIMIDDELDAIENIMAPRYSGFYVIRLPVTQVKQVSNAILNRTPRPQIIHFSGDGENGKIIIPDDENGEVDELNPETLAEYFRNATDVKCVLLNFCYSSQAAHLIAEYIQYVIGIDGDIEDEAAVEFSKNFYDSLGGKLLDQNSVNQAFLNGRAAALNTTKKLGTYIIKTQPTLQPEIQLIEPAEGSPVPWKCQCSGTFKNLPDGASMWAYINATLERKFYLVPIEDYHSDGTWQKEVIIGPEHDTNTYRIGVLIADAEVTKTLNKNFSELGLLRLDDLPNGSKKFGDRAVQRQ